MKSKLIPIALWLLTILWLLSIFTLSSQNGTQTAQTSGGVAQKTAEVIYQQPTQQQINQVHFNIRKSAHVGLFFILGVLSFSASATTFGIKNRGKYLSIAVPVILTSAYGFFDEWHKQFIGGRHFQLDEAVLNMVSGVVGVGVTVAAVAIIIRTIKMKKAKN